SEAGNDNGKEGQGLEEGGEVSHLAAHADAFPLQHRKENDHGDSGDFDAQAAIHNREDVRHILADDDADGASGTAGGQPIAPANDESGILAERAARKIILAAAFWDGGAKFGKLEGADKSVERSAKPDAEEQPVIGQARGDVAGSAYDAGANGIAHGHGNAKAHTENLQELAAVLARAKGCLGWTGRRGISRQWQSGVSRSLASTRHHTFAGKKSKLELEARNCELNTKALARVATAESLWGRQFCGLA